MREISRTFSFAICIILGGISAGIFQASLSVDGWTLPLALVMAVMLLFAAAAVRSLSRHLRRLRVERVFAAQCLSCGYDLRESKDKCPECGTAITPSPHGGHGAPARSQA